MEQKLDILLVDDNSVGMLFFARAANKTHLKIRLQTLIGGRQAIDYLEAKGEYTDRSRHPWPDLVVLDLKMPQVDGFDFLAWRKASALFSSIPVIVFSDSNQPGDMKRIFELGANKHIVKPMDLEDWESVVREIWDFGTQGKAFFRTKGMNSSISK